MGELPKDGSESYHRPVYATAMDITLGAPTSRNCCGVQELTRREHQKDYVQHPAQQEFIVPEIY